MVGLSILSGSHIALIRDVLTRMRAEALDLPLVVGGIIPEEDATALRAMGVAAVYTPKDFQLNDIMADIVKLSDEDLRWLLGAVSIEEGARQVLAKGARVVLITEGAKGAHGFMAGVEVFEPARKVAVVDTVGAGDTFNAGVLASLWRQGCLSKTGVETLSEASLRHGFQAIGLNPAQLSRAAQGGVELAAA